MKLRENLTLRQIGGEYLMISNSQIGLDYTNVIKLSDSAAYLIERTGNNEFTIDTWVDYILEKYEVERHVAAADVQILIDTLAKEGIVVE